MDALLEIKRRLEDAELINYAKSKTTTFESAARPPPGARSFDGAFFFGVLQLPRIAHAASRLPSLRLITRNEKSSRPPRSRVPHARIQNRS